MTYIRSYPDGIIDNLNGHFPSKTLEIVTSHIHELEERLKIFDSSLTISKKGSTGLVIHNLSLDAISSQYKQSITPQQRGNHYFAILPFIVHKHTRPSLFQWDGPKPYHSQGDEFAMYQRFVFGPGVLDLKKEFGKQTGTLYKILADEAPKSEEAVIRARLLSCGFSESFSGVRSDPLPQEHNL